MKVLKERVKDMGTQKKTAESLGISPQFLSDMINGRRDITDRIAELLGLEKSVSWDMNPETVASLARLETVASLARLEANIAKLGLSPDPSGTWESRDE